MKKIIIFVSLVNSCFHYPLFSSLLLLSFCLYQSLSTTERSLLFSYTMSIYSNAKEFTNFLSVKAKELNLKLPQLRKKIADDLEVEKEESIFEQELKSMLTTEELELIQSSEILREKLLRVVKEAASVPEIVWREATLAQMYEEHFEENYLETFARWNIKVDCDKIFTEKDFRILKTKLKALGKNDQGEIVNAQLHRVALQELNLIYCYFAGEEFDILNLKFT